MFPQERIAAVGPPFGLAYSAKSQLRFAEPAAYK
jgi:hypothetical protein